MTDVTDKVYANGNHGSLIRHRMGRECCRFLMRSWYVELKLVASQSGNQSLPQQFGFQNAVTKKSNGWNRGMKLSIGDRLRSASSVGSLRWLCFRLRPMFRHYQQHEVRVGTKAWGRHTK